MARTKKETNPENNIKTKNSAQSDYNCVNVILVGNTGFYYKRKNFSLVICYRCRSSAVKIATFCHEYYKEAKRKFVFLESSKRFSGLKFVL